MTARPLRFVVPRLRDPRVTLALALTLWTVFGQTFLFFNRNVGQLAIAVLVGCVADMLLALVVLRQIMVPISAYITALSIGIMLASNDWRVFAVATLWGIASKYLLRAQDRHFFNPSNFGIVAALLLMGSITTVAAGSQWGGDVRVAVLILILGLMMMRRVKRLDLVLAWMGGFVAMSLLRVALGQGGLVFALGPMTGAEFALFSFSMIPDPKTNPPTRGARIVWGLMIAVLDGILRLLEVRYSMFYALFVFCAALPLIRMVARARGIRETDPWKTAVLVVRPQPGASTAARTAEAPPA